MKIMKTNCINCGAPLSSDGYCKYCNTKIRYTNEIELDNTLTFGKDTEILLKINCKDETMLLPLRGQIILETMISTEDECTEVNLTFSGYIAE